MMQRGIMTESERNALLTMHRAGMTWQQAGIASGRSRTTLKRFARNHGFTWAHEERQAPRYQIKGTSQLMQKQTDMSEPLRADMLQREADRRFVRALAMAFQRGDHLPAGQVPELRLIG